MARKVFVAENWIKVGAFLLALLLWLNVAIRSTYEYSFDVPLATAKLPANLILAEPIPDEVTIRAEASGRDLFLMKFGKPRLVINGSGLRRGKNTVSLKATSLAIPKGVVLKTVEVEDPKVVSVELDKILVKTVRVNRNVELNLREGWIIVGNPQVVPDEVKVTGPYKYARLVRSVSTDTLKLDKVTENIDTDLALVNDYFNVRLDPPVIKYQAQIERLAERRIKNIPVVLLRVPSNIEAVLDEPFITLTVQGGETQVSKLTKQDIKVTLDYPRISRYPKRTFAATIKVPEGIKWTRAEPKKFGLKEKIILKRKVKKRKKY